MKELLPILSITGSDSTGGAGVQGDIKTISALGGYAVTVLTSVAVQNMHGIQSVFNLPSDVVVGQLRSVLNDVQPKAIKVGMIGATDSLHIIVDELKYSSNIVCAPGIETSRGQALMNSEAIHALREKLLPLTTVLVLRQHEAELLLGKPIVSNEEMANAAKQLTLLGAEAVVIYGGHCTKGLLTNVLHCNDKVTFFTLPESDNWKTHGLGGTLSSAITTYLGQTNDIQQAVSLAHEYIKSLVLYSIELHNGQKTQMLSNEDASNVTDRQVEIYNNFMQLVASSFHKQHDVLFYAEKLCVTSRYLSQVTNRVAGKSPKQLIANYIIKEAERQILCTQKTIQEIGFDFGFSSQSQFSKFFKKTKGVSPSQLR